VIGEERIVWTRGERTHTEKEATRKKGYETETG
jgi:hypothetical protein